MNETLLALLVKSVLLSVLALLINTILRRFAAQRVSAAMRHTVSLGMFAALALLPVLSSTLPAWRISPVPYLATPLPLAVRSVEKEATTSVSGPLDSHTNGTSPIFQAPVSAVVTAPTVASTPIVPEATTQTVAPYMRTGFLPALYFSFVVALLARLVVGHIGVWCIVRRARFIGTQGQGTIPIRESSEVAVPLTIGTGLNAVIVLPAGFAAAASPDQLNAVLEHETGHIQRRDYLSQIFADVVCALYFLNPLVGLLVRVLRDEAERATDDRVLAANKVLPSEYAAHLLETVRTLQGRGIPMLAVTMARRSDVGERIQAILRGDASRRDHLPVPLATTLTIAGVGILGIVAVCAPVQGEISPRSNNNPVSFQKRLADGTVVTLLSVARGNTTRQAKPTFWKPTGEILVGVRPYRARYTSGVKIDPAQPETGYELAVSLTGPRADYAIASRTAHSENDATWRMTSQGSLPSNISVVQTKFNEQQDQTSLSIGIAKSKWQTLYEEQWYPAHSSARSKLSKSFTLATSLALSHNDFAKDGWQNQLQYRYIFQLRDGKQLIGRPTKPNTPANHRRLVNIELPIHKSPVAKVRVEGRGYDWVTFSGITLKPKEVDSAFQRNLANETKVEVVAITRHPSWKQPGGAHWWKPDGTPYVGTVPHAPTAKNNMGDHTSKSFVGGATDDAKPGMYEVMTRVTSPYTVYQRGDTWQTDSNTIYLGSLGPVESVGTGPNLRVVQTLFHYVAIKKDASTMTMNWQMKPTPIPWENASTPKVYLTGIALHAKNTVATDLLTKKVR